MTSLLGFLGALGDAVTGGQPGALTRFNDSTDPAAAAQRAEGQATQSALMALAQNRQQGITNPQQNMNTLAQYLPQYTEKAATIQAQNPLLGFGGTNSPSSTYNPTVSGPKDPNADASLPWSTQNTGQTANPQPAQVYSPESPDDKRNYQFLSTLPLPIQGLVKGLSDGDENSGAQAFKSPMSLALQAYAKQFDPSFSQTAFTARNKTATDFASGGKSGQAGTAINTGTHHLAQVVLAGLGLNNDHGTLAGNFIKNWISRQKGDDAVTNFDSTVNTVAPELAKAAAGGGDTDVASREAQKTDFSHNNSPEQLLGAAAGKVQLLQGKADELGNTYKTNMGHGKQIITPENIQTQKDIVALHGLAKSGKLYNVNESNGFNGFTNEAQPIIDRLKVAASDTSGPAQANTQPSTRPPLDKETALAIARQRGLIK